MIVLVSSHSGGHLVPALALGQLLPSALLLVNQSGVLPGLVRDSEVPTQRMLANSRHPLGMIFGLFEMLVRFIRKRPKLVVATGGSVCVPVLLVALLLRIPFVLLEQNVMPGRVTRWFSRYAKHVYLSIPTQMRLPNSSLVGNPILRSMDGNPLVTQFQNGLAHRRVIIVMGGSQGARAINEWILPQYDDVLNSDWGVVHIMGPSEYSAKFTDVNGCLLKNKSGESAVLTLPYLDGMERIYRMASCVVGRAGATTQNTEARAISSGCRGR